MAVKLRVSNLHAVATSGWSRFSGRTGALSLRTGRKCGLEENKNEEKRNTRETWEKYAKQ